MRVKPSQAVIRCISFERGQNRLRRRRFYPPSSYPRLPGFLVPLVGESKAVPAPSSGRCSYCTSGSRVAVGAARPKRAISCCASLRHLRCRAQPRRFAALCATTECSSVRRRGEEENISGAEVFLLPSRALPTSILGWRASVKFAKKGAGRFAAAVSGRKR